MISGIKRNGMGKWGCEASKLILLMVKVLPYRRGSNARVTVPFAPVFIWFSSLRKELFSFPWTDEKVFFLSPSVLFCEIYILNLYWLIPWKLSQLCSIVLDLNMLIYNDFSNSCRGNLVIAIWPGVGGWGGRFWLLLSKTQ